MGIDTTVIPRTININSLPDNATLEIQNDKMQIKDEYQSNYIFGLWLNLLEADNITPSGSVGDYMSDADGENDTIDTTESTARFDTSYYVNIDETTTLWGGAAFKDGTGFAVVHTYDASSDPIIATTFKNEIRRTHIGGSAQCYLRFTYTDDTAQNSATATGSTTTTNYELRTYTNPQPTKAIKTIDIYMQQTSGVACAQGRYLIVEDRLSTINKFIQTDTLTLEKDAGAIRLDIRSTGAENTTLTFDLAPDGSTFDLTDLPIGQWVSIVPLLDNPKIRIKIANISVCKVYSYLLSTSERV